MENELDWGKYVHEKKTGSVKKYRHDENSILKIKRREWLFADTLLSFDEWMMTDKRND